MKHLLKRYGALALGGLCFACGLHHLPSWKLLGLLGVDSQGSYKMPYFLAVSLFKNKSGRTRPWHPWSPSLVTVSCPGALASGNPQSFAKPQALHTLASPHPQLPHLPDTARATRASNKDLESSYTSDCSVSVAPLQSSCAIIVLLSHGLP
jgi:hypothetical protein